MCIEGQGANGLVLNSDRVANSSTAKRPSRGGGYKKSEGSRNQVLDAAILRLAENGLAQTSIQDIANAAGLSKGAVHYHFESKDELLERVLERCCQSIEVRVKKVFEEPGTPIDRVRRAILEMWIVRRDDVPEMRVLTELHGMSRQNEAIRMAFARALERSRNVIVEDGLKELMALGLKPRMSLEIAPRLIMATLDGLSLQHTIERIPPEEEAELLRAIEAMSIALFEM